MRLPNVAEQLARATLLSGSDARPSAFRILSERFGSDPSAAQARWDSVGLEPRMSAARWLARASQPRKEAAGGELLQCIRNLRPEFWLFTVYDKDEAVDLSAKQREILKERVKDELRARRAR